MKTAPELEASGLALLFFLLSAPCVQCQALEPVSPVPEAGTFWSWQLGESLPPMPFLPPFPAPAPVYDLGDGHYLYDDLDVDYSWLTGSQPWLFSSLTEPPDPGEGGGGGGGGGYTNALMVTNLWLEVTAAGAGRDITITITNVPESGFYDLFRTFELVGDHVTNTVWRWVGRGTNGQSFTFNHVRCPHAFYMLGYDVDTDSDLLTDAFELLTSKTSPMTNHTYSVEWDDGEWWLRSNVLVNDPEQDCGNEQNSQFETTIAVVGSNVVVAWVDSNQGVYGLGADPYGFLTNYTPRFVGYAVSRDGGVTFDDRGVPPVNSNGFGDAGDPVLAADRANGVIYLVGTSPRQSGQQKGLPLWKSGDGGVTFTNPIVVRDDIVNSDKPWMAVDDWPDTGQHDVYLTCIGRMGTSPDETNGLWLTVSRDGEGGSWSNAPISIRSVEEANVSGVQSPIIQVAPAHTGYLFWYERTDDGTNWIKMRTVENRGITLGDIHVAAWLRTTNQERNASLDLKRGNDAADTDTFRVLPFPVAAVNPSTNKPGHLYVAYADYGTNTGDKADVYLTVSTNGGTSWTSPARVNTVWTNDQWMPVLAVKPDGTQLFMAWYDRRGDTNNSLMEVYSRWGTISTNGSVTFGTEFIISLTNFPPVFAGTLAANKADGHYDPVYPAGGTNLHWWYPEWPPPPADPEETHYQTFDAYTEHVGEYNGIYSGEEHIIVVWTDYRNQALHTSWPRHQSDVRLVRLPWP